MVNTNILWKKAQEYEKNHNYREAIRIYLKATQIDLKGGKKKYLSAEFNKERFCLQKIRNLDGVLNLLIEH
ncbi:MAG: hypothetical protein ACFFCE_00235 [Promethearchaeota archaeon]